MTFLGFHFGFRHHAGWDNTYFFLGFDPRLKKGLGRFWRWLFRIKKKPKILPDALEAAFDKALHAMADLPKEIKKTKGKDGWITYAEHKKLFRTRDQTAWRSTDDNRLP